MREISLTHWPTLIPCLWKDEPYGSVPYAYLWATEKNQSLQIQGYSSFVILHTFFPRRYVSGPHNTTNPTAAVYTRPLLGIHTFGCCQQNSCPKHLMKHLFIVIHSQTMHSFWLYLRRWIIPVWLGCAYSTAIAAGLAQLDDDSGIVQLFSLSA